MSSSLTAFTDENSSLIEAALSKARGRTSGSIEAVAVQCCSEYERAADVLGLFVALLATLLLLFAYPDARPPLYWVIPTQLIGFLFGTLVLGRVDALRFVLSGRAVMSHRVRQACADCFVSLGLEGRPGVLIFCAMFERQVVVMADSTMADKVRPEIWNEVRGLLLSGLRERNPAEGWANALDRCAAALEKEWPAGVPDQKVTQPSQESS